MMRFQEIRKYIGIPVVEAEALLCDIKHKISSLVKRKSKQRIKVVFLCQCAVAWNKTRQLYETIIKDSRFEVKLLCVPQDINQEWLSGQDNDTWQYFVNQGYDAENALKEDGTWVDLRGLAPDYVFYPRPYNYYLPQQYRTRYVARYAKVCIIMYGMTTAEEFADLVLERDFCRNVYFYFADMQYMRDRCIQHFRITHFLGLRKTLFLGTLTILDILKSKGSGKGSWAFSENDFKVMWTPRWTSDLKLGGTNFLDYHQPFLEYAEKNQDIDFLFRPHPLMFDNFLRTGEMTEQEISEYKMRCQDLVNVQLDAAEEYTDTFWHTDVLVGDISSILPEFFITGKPIIFCVSNMVLKLNDFTKKMCQGCYIARNVSEVFSYIEDIKNGKDVLAEKRKELCKELFGEDLEQTPKRIIEEIVKDCR